VRNKARACLEAGIAGEVLRLPAAVGQEALAGEIDRLNAAPEVDGILLQLPLPGHLSERPLLDRILPEKDVDGFHPVNVGKLWQGESGFCPATPAGVLELLDRSSIELRGRHAVIVGRSNIVGKPMAALLLSRHCTVTLAHSRTRDLAATARQADILVAAVGRAGLIGPEHVREGAVVIDVGMNRVTDGDLVRHLFPGDEVRWARFQEKGSVLTGDVDFHRVAPLCSAITPVPGGVGPLTIAMLLVNTLEAHRRRESV